MRLTIIYILLCFMTMIANAKENDQRLIARVVFAEGCGESKSGKLGIASVIVNRVAAKGYPKNIHDICYQKNAFSSVTNNSRLWKLSENPRDMSKSEVLKWKESLEVVDLVCHNHNIPGIIAFRTINCTDGQKYFSKLELIQTIGHHNFYGLKTERK